MNIERQTTNSISDKPELNYGEAYLCEALLGGNRGRALFTTDRAHCLETTPTILKKPETSHLSNLSFAKTIITRN